MSDIQIDLDTMNPVADIAPVKVEDVEVVFVAFDDCEIRINQTVKRFHKGRATRINRDEARILLEAKKGYIKD